MVLLIIVAFEKVKVIFVSVLGFGIMTLTLTKMLWALMKVLFACVFEVNAGSNLIAVCTV